ncbi:MAG: hypothetical protein GWN86_14735, partial [Desulfobacterales bacterium]|nr:hypothetical protein [Desulfobacterales bacterium]
SMMIYGVGYHILPRFAGKLLKHPKVAEAQFWIANIGLVGMVALDVLRQRGGDLDAYRAGLGIFGSMEVLSILIFFFNMAVTLYAKPPEQA